MKSGLNFFKGNKVNGTEWQISLSPSYKGTASVTTIEEVTKDSESVSYEVEDQDFPSYRAAQLYALDLAKKRKSDGFVCVDEPEDPPELREEDAVAGRFSKEFLIGSFGLHEGKSPHSANLRDLSAIFDGTHFPGCQLPPIHVATIDLDQIEIFPEKVRDYGKLHILYSNHEECDAWMLDDPNGSGRMSFRRGKDGRVAIDRAEEFETSCGGGEPEDVQGGPEWDLFLDAPDPDRLDVRGIRVGGAPTWWQSPEWPDCPDCAQPMFFIAEVQAIQVPPGNAGGDQLLNVFLCEACAVASIVMQCT
ncbi:MAG: hypothetical protein JNM27_23220 [Leptospirales bacterium]|nr:hypothetical protein [Leptospirales bacterium]